MKLGEKILYLRKKEGLSQEALGEKIDVTRQTISNWELGETNPNPDQLKQLSKVFNVSIDELLDNDIQSVLVEKVSNTEKLAGLILKILKMVLIGIPILFLIIIVLSILYKNIKHGNTGREIEETIHCKLYGEEHSYTITYEELTGKTIGEGGDTYFYDILDLYKYDDAHQIFNVINDYVKKNGGTCSKFDGEDVNDIVNMYVKEGSLTKGSATIVMETKNDYEVTFGESFYIEKLNYENNNYEKVNSLPNKDCVFNDIGYILTKDNPRELKQDWSYCLGDLSKGTYRLVKDVNFNSDRPIDEDKTYYVFTEFLID